MDEVKGPPDCQLVAIRKAGEVVAFQLRVGRGGPGETQYFSCRRHGSAEQARRAASQTAAELGYRLGARKSRRGRVARGDAGIRFRWAARRHAVVLQVVASWTDGEGRDRQTSYSVERNGLEGALDRAIEARTSVGTEAPDRERLMEELRRCYESRAGE